MERQDYLDYLTLPTSLYNKIEEDVASVFSQLNICTYPVDPMYIAQQLGYELISLHNINNEVKLMLPSQVADGICHFDPDCERYKIYYHPDGLKERLRFTIGHEIGHIRMGHKCESELARRIADYYSAYLLAPTPWIGYACCEDFADVAVKFGVSDSCAMRCFARYERRKKFQFIKEYENTLLSLISKNGGDGN